MSRALALCSALSLTEARRGAKLASSSSTTSWTRFVARIRSSVYTPGVRSAGAEPSLMARPVCSDDTLSFYAWPHTCIRRCACNMSAVTETEDMQSLTRTHTHTHKHNSKRFPPLETNLKKKYIQSTCEILDQLDYGQDLQDKAFE